MRWLKKAMLFLMTEITLRLSLADNSHLFLRHFKYMNNPSACYYPVLSQLKCPNFKTDFFT